MNVVRKCWVLILCAGFIICESTATAQEDVTDAVEERLDQIINPTKSTWLITPYRPSYIMPVTYFENPNEKPFTEDGSDVELDKVELKFQFSLMLHLAEDLPVVNGDLFFGYTQVSFWQAYNQDASEFFRDTNYEPEAFILYDLDGEVAGLNAHAIRFGLVHQSNGRGLDTLTRSWNRLYTEVVLGRGGFSLALKPWLRLGDSEENPDIDKYLGYGEVRASYKQEAHTFSSLFRNNLRRESNRGAVEISWTFPLTGRIKGFAQYFYGYGENLLDYDELNQRIGLGVTLNDFL